MHRHINVHPGSVTAARTLTTKCLHINCVAHIIAPSSSNAALRCRRARLSSRPINLTLVHLDLSISRFLAYEKPPIDQSNQFLYSQVNL